VRAAVGAVRGWITALGALGASIQKLFAGGRIAKIVDDFIFKVRFNLLLAQEAISDAFKAFRTNITARVVGFADTLTDLFKGIRTALNQRLLSFVNMFAVADDSPTGKAIQRFRSIIQSIRNTVVNIVKAFAPIGDLFVDAFNIIRSLLPSAQALGGVFTSIKNAFTPIFNALKSAFGALKTVGSVVGRVFAPLTFIITAFETIRGAIEGFKEGGILGGLQGAIDGFITTLITAPLDFIKSGVAWVADKLGFDETAGFLRSFSFTGLWESMTGAIFDGIRSAFEWIKTLFTDPVAALRQLWTALVGAGEWLVDIVYAPINAAINWVTGLFGWGDPNEPFKLQDWVMDTVIRPVINWFKTLFSNPVEALGQLFAGYVGVFTTIGSWIWDNSIKPIWDWVSGLFGGGEAPTSEELGENIMTKVRSTIQAITDVIEFVMNNFTSVKDLVTAQFNYEITRIQNGFEAAFAKIITFIKNIPDQLYLLLYENLRLTLPKMAIPLPRILGGGELVLAEGGSYGFGDQAAANAARTNIADRAQELEDRLSSLANDTSVRLSELQAAREIVGQAYQAQQMAVAIAPSVSSSTVNIRQGDTFTGESVARPYRSNDTYRFNEAIGAQ
jgi:phage-related protein